jgi:hypothetical protein
LWRVYQELSKTTIQLKIAAYKKSSPPINIDWTLDALLSPNGSISLNNDNVHVYYEQIKTYGPDLIISDLDYFTSYIARLLNIPLWQYSSSLINFAISHKSKYNTGLSNQYLGLLKQDSDHYQKIVNIIINSDRRMVYSHFGDINTPPNIKSEYEWTRPYHQIGKPYKPCTHQIVAGLLLPNVQISHMLKHQDDSVIFSEFPYEKYSTVISKPIWKSEDYYCNIFNSPLFVCEGQTSFLADAFYNGKFSITVTNYKDLECITNSLYSRHLGLSASYYLGDDINQFMDKKIQPLYSASISLLHEDLKDA